MKRQIKLLIIHQTNRSFEFPKTPRRVDVGGVSPSPLGRCLGRGLSSTASFGAFWD